jgi:hypothetical protein
MRRRGGVQRVAGARPAGGAEATLGASISPRAGAIARHVVTPLDGGDEQVELGWGSPREDVIS